MAQPANGTLTDVPGLRVGHWTDAAAATGCSVVICPPDGAVAGVDVRGSAPGTRELSLLDPVNTVERVHALLLSGGSAFGLAAADGVMRWMEEQGRGFPTPVARVPIVPAAILFDLAVGRADVRPTAESGYAACQAASTAPVAQGAVGAGTGCTVGKMRGMGQASKGGLGSASRRIGAVTVGALVAVNAVGSVIDPATNAVVSGVRAPHGDGFVDPRRLVEEMLHQTQQQIGQNTTLAVVAANVTLTKAGATKVAQMAHDGLARTIMPVHTAFDGDTIFALATGEHTADPSLIGALAADVLVDAVLNAMRAASGQRSET